MKSKTLKVRNIPKDALSLYKMNVNQRNIL